VFTLTRANHSKGRSGETLPVVWPELERARISFRRGQVTLVAAAPGVGKSVLAMSLVLRAGVPAFYFSADTDASTMNQRAAAALTAHSLDDVEQAYEVGMAEFYDQKLQQLKQLRWDFNTSPDVEQVERDVTAFATVYGEWPHIVIVDNLSNMVDDASDFAQLEAVLMYLKDLGRQTGAAMIVLHHLTGEYDDGNTPVPMKGLRGKISKTPEMILTLFRAGPGVLGVSPVKNRTGKADASGNHFIQLPLDLERMQLG
jgi:predicted ATP-dependent serine protease